MGFRVDERGPEREWVKHRFNVSKTRNRYRLIGI